MDSNEILRLAVMHKTIIPAFNVPRLPMLEPIVAAIVDEDGIAMVQVAKLEWGKFDAGSLEAVAEEYARFCDEGHTLLHLDHIPEIDEDDMAVDVLPIIRRAIDAGYGSVMVDASRLPFVGNVASTRRVADMAHAAGIYAEAELGSVAGHESGGIGMDYEELFRTRKGFTDIGSARDFVRETGCDWLSVAVGSVHGAIAANTRNDIKPEARLDIGHIKALREATGGIPLVLHGGSGINRECILEAVASGIAKINVGTEVRQAYDFALRDEPGDILNAQDKVYDKVRHIMRHFLNVSGNRSRFFPE
ncbi:MAG: class II fructose-bisphosphate aldolase [Oscillospiraceae bacterium]|nr:class II fructose-bisphosphate aldolase [Oscillospiraceae bacterium]